MRKTAILLGIIVFLFAGAACCLAAPVIVIEPNDLNFTALEGEPNPAAQIFYISNPNPGKLEWEIFEDCPWLSVDPASGGCVDETDEVTVSVDITSLLGGQYTCELIVSDPDAANSPQVLTVNLYMDEILLEVPSEYPTIQSAIDSAGNGDTIIVADGTYTGDGNRDIGFKGKKITVRSASGAQNCVIDCQGSDSEPHRGFLFQSGEDANSILEGFTVINGYQSQGGGIYCFESSPVVKNCVISGNVGQGIYCRGGSPTIVGCRITGSRRGIHLYLADANIVNCVIVDNDYEGYYSSGMYIYRGRSTITNCTFSKNKCYNATIYTLDAWVVFENCIFRNNEVSNEIVISFDAEYKPLVHRTVLRNCCVEGGHAAVSGYYGLEWGPGNIDRDPHFVDGEGGDYRLMPGSLCIDAGTNSPESGLALCDIDGNDRRVDGDNDGLAIVDMGAYETAACLEPVIRLSEDKFEFAAPYGVTECQVLEVRNSGLGVLNWTIEEDCDWLEVDPVAGSSTGQSEEVVLTVDCAGLADGFYNCELTARADGAVNEPWSVPVELRVGVLRVPYEYATIQAAIYAAVDGDTVIVADGTYTGEGNCDIDFLGKAITVRSENGAENCIIDCQGDWLLHRRGFVFVHNEDANSVLDCVTICNGSVGDSWPEYIADGAGIKIFASCPTIKNCVLSYNKAIGNGGAVFVGDGSSPKMIDCKFIDNYATYGGGGLCIDYSSSATILRCEFQGNHAAGYSYLGGGAINNSGIVEIEGCTFFGNTGDYGGAINNSGIVEIEGCNFLGNTGEYGGAIKNYIGAYATINNCSFMRNYSEAEGANYPDFFSGGGGICNSGELEVYNTMFIGNYAAYAGGAIDCAKGSETIIRDCTFNDNNSAISGGAVFTMFCSPEITECIFRKNAADFGGGGIRCLQGSPIISDCVFDENSANNGGGITAGTYTNPIISNCVFTNNTAQERGGGAHLVDNTTIKNCLFSNNRAGTNGGGIYSDYRVLIELSVFKSNTAVENGGGVYAYDDATDVKNSLFSDNRASYGAGAYGRAGLEMNNCTLTGNAALYSGSGVKGYVNISNSILWANQNLLSEVHPWEQVDEGNVRYSCIQGGWDGEGNIDVEPMFVEAGYWIDNGTPEDRADDLWIEGEYILRRGSSCIDAGDPNYSEEEGETDIAGNDRVLDGNDDSEAFVDMGAYEFVWAPRIHVEPKMLVFHASSEITEPNEQMLMIENVGGGVLNWRISEGCRWLEVSPAGGDSVGEVDEVIVSVNAADLPEGLYCCDLIISDSESVNGQQVVAVVLAVEQSHKWLVVPVDCETIQGAIDAADPNFGDVVVVGDGTYIGFGNRDINFRGKAITVRSLHGAESCIIDCRASEEYPHRGFKFDSGEDRNAVLDGFTITNGYAPVEDPYEYPMGGAIYCSGSSPTISNCIIERNYAVAYGSPLIGLGGGVSCFGSNPVITKCRFINNKAYAGGAIEGRYSDPVLSGCSFMSNDSSSVSAVLFNYGLLRIDNCTFANNKSLDFYEGDGSLVMFSVSDDSLVNNCTFFGNYTGSSGGGIYCIGCSPRVENCILWANIPDQIYGDPEVSYCDIEGGWEGVGNIDVEPLFVDAENSDYHLRWSSPCIDAGDPNYIPSEDEVDIDGEPRLMAGRVDMGADEVGPKQADFTRDGRIDISDLSVLSRSWETIEGEGRWYVLSDLFEDGVIGLDDLAMFVEDWMWQADWY